MEDIATLRALMPRVQVEKHKSFNIEIECIFKSEPDPTLAMLWNCPSTADVVILTKQGGNQGYTPCYVHKNIVLSAIPAIRKIVEVVQQCDVRHSLDAFDTSPEQFSVPSPDYPPELLSGLSSEPSPESSLDPDDRIILAAIDPHDVAVSSPHDDTTMICTSTGFGSPDLMDLMTFTQIHPSPPSFLVVNQHNHMFGMRPTCLQRKGNKRAKNRQLNNGVTQVHQPMVLPTVAVKDLNEPQADKQLSVKQKKKRRRKNKNSGNKEQQSVVSAAISIQDSLDMTTGNDLLGDAPDSVK
ncbi:hypothetical protein BGZ65_009655 [Modicella reniformis]|uniref:Uncharacterized protein n=1 Tax=Modicella reniformis TaxID=1440133 RepID=A0A9P6ISX5_9FUNG|nr:hypothetical protein BGZ65_009655 [Modicella reniformis]